MKKEDFPTLSLWNYFNTRNAISSEAGFIQRYRFNWLLFLHKLFFKMFFPPFLIIYIRLFQEFLVHLETNVLCFRVGLCGLSCMVFIVSRCRLENQLHCLLLVWSWTNHLMFLGLSFLYNTDYQQPYLDHRIPVSLKWDGVCETLCKQLWVVIDVTCHSI